MNDEERQAARAAFEDWSALTQEMIDDGSLPGDAIDAHRLRSLLAGPERPLAGSIFLAGFMSVKAPESTVLDLDEDDVRALHRVYLAARYLMLGGGWTRERDGALFALERAVLEAHDAMPDDLKG